MSFTINGAKSRPDAVKPPRKPSDPLTTSQRNAQSRRSSNASSTASFHSAHFPPEEEARLVAASNELKTAANAQFSRQDYSSALSTYDKAVAECPSYLDYELSVLSSNIAACYLRLEEWKDALQAAEKGMEGLEKIIPLPKAEQEKSEKPNANGAGRHGSSIDQEDQQVFELPEDTTDADAAALFKNLDISDQRKADVHRIRTKLLLRRARARYMLGTNAKDRSQPGGDEAKSSQHEAFGSSSAWSNLSSAQSDYQLLSQPEYFATLPNSDKKTIQTALATLPSLVEQAKEKEVGEMMGKLKELGNGILKPFGLSTDMFKMDKDPNTGGMSLRFDGNAGK